jgi:bifunctional DNase/RNase
MTDSSDDLRMEVRGLMLDPTSNAPVVLLRDEAGEAILPIWIGPFEATAISLVIERQEVPRPMTHDLFMTVLRQLGGEVEKVVITDLKEGTFFAELHVTRGDEALVLDARPSDAIALALRAGRPILVRRSVLEKAQAIGASAEEEDAQERLRRILEELDPDDLGKYTM